MTLLAVCVHPHHVKLTRVLRTKAEGVFKKGFDELAQEVLVALCVPYV